jgi:hypothetical protein
MTVFELSEQLNSSLNAAQLLTSDLSIPEPMGVSELALLCNISLDDAAKLKVANES